MIKSALTAVNCVQIKSEIVNKIDSLMDKKTVNSTLPWPINGGRPVTSKQTKSDHENVMLTGHEDGSGKFYCIK